MKLDQIFADLLEAPIEDLTLAGDWSQGHSFRHANDRKLLTNPKAQAKIIQKWERTKVPFNLYFINMNKDVAYRHAEHGEVSEAWLAENMPEVPPLVTIREDAVNVLYTNNAGSPREPMTAWIIAHRFGHAIRRTDDWEYAVRRIQQTLKRVFGSEGYDRPEPHVGWGGDGYERKAAWERMVTTFAQHVGTFRSAREGQIARLYEFYIELFAQYLITGKITFKPAPRSFGHGKQAWGRHTEFASTRYGQGTEAIDEMLESLSYELDGLFESMLEGMIGRIFVM